MNAATMMLPGLEADAAPAVRLTPAQRRALEAIERHEAATGSAPTVRQLAAELGTASSYAGRVLDALVAAGVLRRTPGRARGVAVVAEGAYDGT